MLINNLMCTYGFTMTTYTIFFPTPFFLRNLYIRFTKPVCCLQCLCVMMDQCDFMQLKDTKINHNFMHKFFVNLNQSTHIFNGTKQNNHVHAFYTFSYYSSMKFIMLIVYKHEKYNICVFESKEYNFQH